MTDGGQDFDLGQVVGSQGEKGDTGATGNGIASIELRSTSGKNKTYRITYTDGDHFDYVVKDGSDASVTIVDNLTSTSSTSALSAKQGKVLNDLIGDAITYINGTGGS